MAYCDDCVLNALCSDSGMKGQCKGYLSKTRGPERCLDCMNLDKETNHCKLTGELVGIYYYSCENFKRSENNGLC